MIRSRALARFVQDAWISMAASAVFTTLQTQNEAIDDKSQKATGLLWLLELAFAGHGPLRPTRSLVLVIIISCDARIQQSVNHLSRKKPHKADSVQKNSVIMCESMMQV